MPKAFSLIALHSTRGAATFAEPWSFSWRLDAGSIDDELARVFAAIRECARIAWWDGSAIGLHLNGVFGMFDALDTTSETGRGDML